MGPSSHPTCRVIRPGEPYQGKQGLTYLAGISGESAGSKNISMIIATMPPGARAKAHLHRGIETAIYLIEGEVETWFGPELGEHVVCRAGDYVYISPDLPHLVLNRSDRPCRAVITHTAADDQEGIVLLPELDGRVS